MSSSERDGSAGSAGLLLTGECAAIGKASTSRPAAVGTPQKRMKPAVCATETGLILGVICRVGIPLLLGAEPRRSLEAAGGTIMRGNLEKRGGPAPFRGAVLAFLLIGG